MADPVYPVDAPTRTPRRGGIRSVAEFRDDNRIAMGGTLAYTTTGCTPAVGTLELCYPSPADPQPEKSRQGVEIEEGAGTIFGLYYGSECWIEGEDYEAASRAGLELGEDRGIEAALNTWLGTALPASTPPTVTEAIAIGETFADNNWAGAPILIMNRGDAVRAAAEGSLEFDEDGNLWTPNGTKVLSSGRIAARNVYFTGALTVYRSAVIVNRTRDLELNKEFAIAERTYGVLVDCGQVVRYTVTPAV